MIIPERPDVFSDSLFPSKQGLKALDNGYEWYCYLYKECIVEGLSEKRSKSLALHGAMYKVMLELQRKVQENEQMEKINANHN